MLKGAILILAYYVIYRQVFIKHSWQDIVEHFSNFYSLWALVVPLIGIVLMMLLNWGTESLKWQFLIRKNEKISLGRSAKGVFSGVTISSMTPNRVGEYFGRVFILKKTHPVRGILMTIVGSISQLLVTMTVGGLALLFVMIVYPASIYLETIVLQSIAIAVLMISLFILGGLYFNLKIISNIADRATRRWPKVNRFANVFSYYNRRDLLRVFLFSLLRYFIFSMQFYLLMRIFHLEFNLLEGYIIIALIFLGITVIPTVALAELGVRGSVAVFVLSGFFASQNMQGFPGYELDIMAASAVLWLINIVLPALIGSIFIFDLSFFKYNRNGD